VKIAFNRSVGGQYRDEITIIDRPSASSHGISKPVTIKARNSYAYQAGTGAGVEALALSFGARMKVLYTKPLRTWRVPLNLGKAIDMAPGEIVTLTSRWLRDPTTGARGVTNRACMALSVSFNFGSELTTPAEPPTAEAVFLYSAEERIYEIAPNAMVDNAYSSDSFTSGWKAGTKQLKLESYEFGRSMFGVKDVEHFEVGDIIHVTELDPASGGDQFTDEITAIDLVNEYVTLDEGFGSGGRPAFSSSKRYRIGYASFSEVTTSQKLKAFQADPTDGKIDGSTQPNLYGDGLVVGRRTSTDPTEAPDHFHSALYGDDRPMETANFRDLAVFLNNFLDYKSAIHCPIGNDGEQALPVAEGVITFFPIYMGGGGPPAGMRRDLYIAPFMIAGSGGDARIRVYTSLEPPSGDTNIVSGSGVTFPGGSRYVEFARTSTTWGAPTTQTLKPIYWPDSGITWITVTGWDDNGAGGSMLRHFETFYQGPVVADA
jgi:hypothetical protein